jgi:hypothetical protein
VEDYLLAHPWLLAALAVFGWFFVLSLIARLGGWSELADRYAFEANFDGPRRGLQSLSLERIKLMPMSYNNVVTVGADVRGLYLAMFVLFRPFHPPVLIPWADIAAEERKALLLTRIDLRARGEPDVKITIAQGLAEWLAQNSAGAFRLPSPAIDAAAA